MVAMSNGSTTGRDDAATFVRDTGPARRAYQAKMARLASEDPARLAKAVRIVRAGIQHNRVTVGELTAPDDAA